MRSLEEGFWSKWTNLPTRRNLARTFSSLYNILTLPHSYGFHLSMHIFAFLHWNVRVSLHFDINNPSDKKESGSFANMLKLQALCMGFAFEHIFSFLFLSDVFELASTSFCLLLNYQQLGVTCAAVTMCFILLLADKRLLEEGLCKMVCIVQHISLNWGLVNAKWIQLGRFHFDKKHLTEVTKVLLVKRLDSRFIWCSIQMIAQKADRFEEWCGSSP